MKCFNFLICLLSINSFAQVIQLDSVETNQISNDQIDIVLDSLFIQKDVLLPKQNITLVAVGDIMLGTNFPNDGYLPPREINLLAPVDSILRDADVTFGNLEGTILDEGGEVKNVQILQSVMRLDNLNI